MLQTLRSQPAIIKAAADACRRHFVYALVFSALVNVLFIAPMLYMLQVYDRVLPTAGSVTLLFLTIVLVFALIALSGLDAIRSRLLVRASVRLDRVLSSAILEATLARPELGAQRIAKQALREFDVLRQTMTGPVMVGVLDAPWIPVYIVVAALIHPWIGALAFFGACLSLFLAWRNERATNEPLKAANQAAGQAYAAFEFTVASAEVVRALGLRRALVRGHLGDRHKMMQMQTDASISSSGLTALSKFVRLTLQSLALGIAALLAIDAKVSPGAVFASSFIIGRALAPIDQIVGGWRNIVHAWGAYQTLRDLFAETPADIALTQLPSPEGSVAAENLGVAGDDNRAIVMGITFAVRPGEMIAIVGPSGAGKSTLVRALAGAAIPAAGVIRFDGADQRNWDPERLAEHIGYMPQETSLFAGTVKENIARFRNLLGEEQGAVDDAVVEAARTAGAHEMILRLQGGYDYPLGLGGRGLSVGQSQRISLARALFRDPQYLFLDEPNSNLDAEGDQQLVQTLDQLKRRGRTILIVAHRLSVLPIVDRLMVIQDGRLTMFGLRDEILSKLVPPPAPKRVVTARKTSS